MRILTRKKQNQIIELLYENEIIMKTIYLNTDVIEKDINNEFSKNSDNIAQLACGYNGAAYFHGKMINYLNGLKKFFSTTEK